MLSILGWLLFPAMYLLVGIFTVLDLSVEASFLIASPVGMLGFCCWVTALIISVVWLFKAKNLAVAFGGLVSSAIPLTFLGFGFWMAINGVV